MLSSKPILYETPTKAFNFQKAFKKEEKFCWWGRSKDPVIFSFELLCDGIRYQLEYYPFQDREYASLLNLLLPTGKILSAQRKKKMRSVMIKTNNCKSDYKTLSW